MADDKMAEGKSNVDDIMNGVGSGPAMPVSETDPTGQKPRMKGSMHDFMSDAELRPNTPGGNTHSF